MLTTIQSPIRGETRGSIEQFFFCFFDIIILNYDIVFCRIVSYPDKFTLALHFPRYFVNGTYNIDGQLLFLQLKGRGPFEMVVGKCYDALRITPIVRCKNHRFIFTDDVRGTFVVKTKIFKRADGVEMVGVRSCVITIRFDKCKIRLYNLFNGDQVLTDTVNQALNANMDVIAADLMPLLEKRYAVVFTDIIDGFFRHFTRKQLFQLKND